MKFIIAGSILCLTQVSNAQLITPGSDGLYLDVDQVSRRHFGGTARNMGIAGAQTALGGDLSATHTNPAGLGVYRSSDANATIGIQLNNTSTGFNSNFYNGTTNDNIDNFHLGNIGVVFAQSDDSEYSDWKSEGIAINYARLSNYHTRYSFLSKGNTYNFRDYIGDLGNGFLDEDGIPTQTPIPPSLVTSDNFDAANFNEDLVGLGYYSFLLNDRYNPNTDSFEDSYDIINAGALTTQEGEVSITGGQSQWDIGYGANYQDKINIGIGMGIATFKRNISTVYKEELENPTNTDGAEFRSLTYSTEEETRGTGVNFKAGLIARPSDIVRIGLAIETPTFYRMNQKFTSSISTFMNGGFAPVIGEDGNTVDQRISGDDITSPKEFRERINFRTPYRFTAGLALFAGKNGFISADAEYVMHTRSRITSRRGSSAFEDNSTLKNLYQNVLNLRVGGEYRMDDFRLRGGYAYYPNTVRNNETVSTQRQFITGGAGYYVGANYFDIAVVYANYASDYAPFPNDAVAITNDHQDVSLMFTYGLRF